MNKKKIFIGKLLIEKGLITHDDLEKALKYVKQTGFRIGHALIELDILKDEDIADVLTEQHDQKCIVVKKINLSKEILNKLSYEFCTKNKCIPIGMISDELITAVVDPYDFGLLDDIKFLTGYSISPQFATEHSIHTLIEKTYKGKSNKTVIKHIKSDSHIINLVNQIIMHAIDRGVSDIHIENFDEKINLRYRIDGELISEKEPDKKDIRAIISRIKIMANLDIAEKRLSQDGRIIIKDKDYDVDIRVSIIPTIYGENIVLRILDKKSGNFELTALGLNKKNEAIIKKVLKKTHGLVLITGPTGSGKTTTLYSMLKILKDRVLSLRE